MENPSDTEVSKFVEDPMIAHIKKLITEAANSSDSNDALKFSQAANNAANALCAIASSKKI